jgi:hypothetical protein
MIRDQQKSIKDKMHSHIHMNQNSESQTIYIIIEAIRQQKKGL